MTIQSSHRAAFINLRLVAALLLCAISAILAALAVNTPHLSSRLVAANSPRGGGSAALNREPSEIAQGASQNQPAIDYAGPRQDFRPVRAVRSGELRYTRPVHPSNAPKHEHPEPIRPPGPTQSGGPEGPLQTAAGPQYSAPSPSGTGFDGVGTGTADSSHRAIRRT